MKLPIVKLENQNSLREFVLHWRKLYSYGNEEIYLKSINQTTLSKENLRSLYEWKNGMTLSKLKNASFQTKIEAKLSIINRYKSSEFTIDQFNREFSDLSAVWKIFLLHVIDQHKYPIYDQNIHRTYCYINNLDYSRIASNFPANKVKLKFYHNEYLPFVTDAVIKEAVTLKQIDEAFFSFGRFLKGELISLL